MQTEQSWSGWSLILTWVIMNFIGIIVAIIVTLIAFFNLPYVESPIGNILSIGILVALLGFVLGIFQWLSLRATNIAHMGQWAKVTGIGLAIGSITASGGNFFLSTQALKLASPIGQILAGILIGATLGTAQWFVLRLHSSRSRIWIIGNAISMGAVFSFPLGSAEGATDAFQATFPAIIFIFRGVILYSIITAILLTWVLNKNLKFVFLSDSPVERQNIVKALSRIAFAIILGAGLIAILRDNQDKYIFRGHTSVVTDVVFSPDITMLASSSYDGTIKLWDVATGKEIRTLYGSTQYLENVTFSPNGTMLASGSLDGKVQLWDVASGKQVHVFGDSELASESAAAFSPDGTQLAWGSHDNEKIHLWDIVSGKEVRVFDEGNASLLVFSPDGRLLASGGLGEICRIWDVATGAEIHVLQGYSAESIAFSPGGKLLASGHSIIGNDPGIILWDVTSGQEVRTFGGQLSVQSIAFSPDGTQIAVGYLGESELLLFDISTGHEVGALRGHSDYIRTVAFSPDGKLLASGSQDKTVRIWDLSKIK